MLEIVTARQQLKLQRSPVLTNVKTWSHQKGQNMKRKTKTLTNKRGLFIGVLLFGVCYGQIAPLYEAQSSLTSGTLVAAGSIGVVALAATVAVAALSVRRDVRNCYCQTTTQTPEESCADKCEDLVASERAKYEKENEDRLNYGVRL
uniref:Uncharacterized protein n=1 Tax=Magallana gigas TaxID=29159 RepID=A0A8W8NJ50_MAGGI